jgi:hypothetical protein
MKVRPQFILLGFIVGVVSDLILRDLDHPRFRPYFASRGYIEAATIGGVIVVIVLLGAALVVDPRERTKYLVAVTVSSFLTAAAHDATLPLGPEIRAHSDRRDSRILDTLVGPFSALVVYGIQDYILPPV